jgi:hypothetical protein
MAIADRGAHWGSIRARISFKLFAVEDRQMAMDMLQHLAESRLPVTLYAPEEIDQVKRLRAADLIVALTPAPSDPMKLSGAGGGCTSARDNAAG